MIHLTDKDFEEKIRKAEKPVLVDFYADWCPPCSILAPILENLEKEYEGKVIFAKVNVDNSPVISQKFGINPIPTVILFKEGKPVGEFMGLRPEPTVKEWLDNLLRNENG